MNFSKRIASFARWLRHDFIRLNFYRAHLFYFVVSILVSSAIFWVSSTNDFQVQYIDALFMCATAMTNCGLATVDMSALNAYQQSILFVLMALGDLSIASISVVWVRRYFFGRKIHDLLKHSKAARRLAEDIEEQRHQKHVQCIDGAASTSLTLSTPDKHPSLRQVKRKEVPGTKLPVVQGRHRNLPRTQSGYGGLPAPWETNIFRAMLRWLVRLFGRQPAPNHHYLSFAPELDSRGRLHNLSSAQLEELGGVEYRALGVLTWLLPAYTMLWLSLSWIILLPYTTRSSTENIIRTSQAGNTNPRWWAFFLGLSAYSNTGLNLLDQNMIPFSNDYLILIITGAIVLGGNTFYPIFLRLAIWTLSKIIPKHTQLQHSLTFLLHHPRRCFLFLFPAKSTWYLCGIQIIIFALVWLSFEVLNINYPPIMDQISNPGQRTMDGLFQAVGVRSSGFYITNQSNLSPACQIYYMVNMYFSAIPFIVSLRSTNIYEERSIGQESNEPQEDDSKHDDDNNRNHNHNHNQNQNQNHDTDKTTSHLSRQDTQRSTRGPNIQAHLQNQLAYDLWWIILAVFLVTIIERDPLAGPTQEYSVFSVIFEVVSAYGTIGLSLGVPDANISYSGTWARLSKLILVAVMVRGRHRILPLAVDRAVLLPGQKLMDRLDRVDMLVSPQGADRVWRKYEEIVRNEEQGRGGEHDLEQEPKEEKEEGYQQQSSRPSYTSQRTKNCQTNSYAKSSTDPPPQQQKVDS